MTTNTENVMWHQGIYVGHKPGLETISKSEFIDQAATTKYISYRRAIQMNTVNTKIDRNIIDITVKSVIKLSDTVYFLIYLNFLP